MKLYRYILLVALIICLSENLVLGATRYIRQGANGSGTNWADAYGSFDAAGLNNSNSTTPRGNIYYVADGSYGSITFKNSKSGSEWITIKKATEADHGNDVGWNSSYGDGQAVLGGSIRFQTDYILLDGNGTHTVPSDKPSDYGFKVSSNSSTSTSGIFQFGAAGVTVSNITLRYTHGYNTTNGDINNGTVMARFYPGAVQKYIKLQNCYFQNCGKDGIQISDSAFILIERCYMERLGRLRPGTPDYHGQTVQIFYGGDDIIFRWNIWEACEGQGLVQIAGIGDTSNRIRFYGNLVFVKYGETNATPGFNTSGGLIGNAWNYNSLYYIIHYNNTFVNIGGSYGGVSRFPLNKSAGNNYGYNNLLFNCQSTSSSGWNGYGYHASGQGDTAGGTNEQTGLNSSIFLDYTGNNFRLIEATEPGKHLTDESWWDGSSDPFFTIVDSHLDMNGIVRGADGVWDRGAFEYGTAISFISPPSNLRIINQ